MALIAVTVVMAVMVIPSGAVTQCQGQPVDPDIPNSGGTSGADDIEGDNTSNSLGGDSGDDDILGYGGIDYLCGNPDQDNIGGGGGIDFINAGDNRDPGTNTLPNSTIFGSSGGN
jgi:hypothetical protein